ncbi:MAG: four helix bundle protein, partial [Lentisphaerae bacterium]|nr:four helix bundle protein [Lentisphaerota bacterium]
MTSRLTKTDLEKRTKLFAINLIVFISTLPRSNINDVILYQLLKAGTSIGANYREANRAESKNDFKHKIGIVQKEASETQYWLELMNETNLFDKSKVLP